VATRSPPRCPGPGRAESNVVGVRIMPVFATKAIGMGMMVAGVLALMSGLLTINAIWTLGPYNPSQVSAGSQPDIYMLWTDGVARVMPAWELYIGNYTIPSAFWVALLCGLMVVLLMAYPFLEKKFTGDDARQMTGSITQERLLDYIQQIADRQTEVALSILSEVLAEGKDPARFIEDTILLVRDMLLYQQNNGDDCGLQETAEGAAPYPHRRDSSGEGSKF